MHASLYVCYMCMYVSVCLQHTDIGMLHVDKPAIRMHLCMYVCIHNSVSHVNMHGSVFNFLWGFKSRYIIDVCIYIHTLLCMSHVCVHEICLHNTCMCSTCMYVFGALHVCMCSVYVFMHVCYVCMYVHYVCACMYVHIHTLVSV
jgi:hypothetical protein